MGRARFRLKRAECVFLKGIENFAFEAISAKCKE